MNAAPHVELPAAPTAPPSYNPGFLARLAQVNELTRVLRGWGVGVRASDLTRTHRAVVVIDQPPAGLLDALFATGRLIRTLDDGRQQGSALVGHHVVLAWDIEEAAPCT